MVTVRLIGEDIKSVETSSIQANEVKPLGNAIIYQGQGYYKFGNGLKAEEDAEGQTVVSVDVADKAEENNTLPITAAAVYQEIGNIDALLGTI